MRKPMKHRRIILISIPLILFIILIGIFFFQIQALKTPDITITFEPTQFTSQNISVHTNITITNPNSFEIIMGNITIHATTPDDVTYLQLHFPGGVIPARQSLNIVSKEVLSFQGAIPEMLTCEITGVLGVRLLALFEKSLPYTIYIVTPLQQILTNITTPKINIETHLSSLTEHGVTFNGSLSLTNPNNYALTLHDLILLCITDTGEQIGEITVSPKTINEQESTILSLQGILPYTALNADMLTFTLTGSATAHIAGISQSIPISSQASFSIPDLQDLLFIKEPLDFTLSGEFKIRLRGLVATIGFSINNPSNIPLEVRDLVCSIEAITKNITQILGEQSMEQCTISPHDEICRTTQIIIPYRNLLMIRTGKLFPDWYQISIQANVSIQDVHQSIPISLKGSISPHILI